MRRSSAITIIALGAAVAASDAEAKLDLFIDKSTQQISVIQNGRLLYVWPVSTGQDRFSTPSGVYTPERLERTWFSKAYYNSPMPHAIFFHHGFAIHGSYDIARLGGPASHGCVRLHPQDAALLYGMVEQEGPGNTTIVLGGGWSPNPMPPRYRDLDEPLRPAYGGEGAARGAYPPGPQTPPYRGDGGIARGTYPPGPQMPPYRGDSGIARGTYPPGPQMPPYRGDSGIARGAYPPGPQTPPYRGDGGIARGDYPPGPQMPPHRGDGGMARGDYPAGPQMPPYYNADPYVEGPGPGRRRGDNSQMATRGPYPANRPPAPRLDAQASIDPTLGPRGSYRPPATAKSNSKCPTCSPNRASDEPQNRHVSASETAQSPPPAPSPPASSPLASSPPPPATAPSQPEQQQSATGYKVLPRSYWAGASWRWRLKAEHEISGVASSGPDSQ
jgi:L,D-transpeptidase-like protein